MAKYSEEANRLWPYLLPKIERVSGIGNTGGGTSGSVGVGGAPSPHSMDSAHHTGTITNAQGPQFLLTDGTRTLTGNLAVTGGITIDGVDLSAHVADPNAHHDAATAGNTAISLTGQAISVALNATSGLEVSSGLRLADSVAGAGLTIASKVLAVGAGDGIDTAADAISVDVTDIINTSYGIYEPTANDIGINLAANSGLTFSAGALAVDPGDGLEVAADLVAVDLATNSGLTFSSGDLAMGTPTVVSAVSINSVTTNTHQHAVTASSNVGTSAPGVDMLLKSTSAGGLTLGSLTVTGAATVDQGLTAGDTGFRVIYHTHDYNHVHTVINPGGGWSLDEQFGLDIDDNLLVRGWIVGKHAIQIDGATMLLHFDGPERVGDLSGQTTGHMGQVPTSLSGVTFGTGKFGKAVQTPPSVTNYVTNPSVELGTTGWANYVTGGATGTRTRVTTEAYAGSYSYELVKATGATTARWGVEIAVSVFSITTWTASAWVKCTEVTGGTTPLIRAETGGVFAFSSTNISAPTDGWQRLVWTFTSSGGGTGYLYFYLDDALTGTFYVDAVQVEQRAYATAYADGTLGTGHSWETPASPHASRPLRTAAELVYNSAGVINRRAGSFMCWFKPTTAAADQIIFSVGSATWVRATSGGVFQLCFGGTEAGGGSATYAANTWTHLAYTWEDDEINFYVDGALSRNATPAVWGGMSTALTIGYYGPSGNQHNSGVIDDVVILNRAATEDEIRAIFESNAPVFAETSTWHWRSARNRIYADSEGLWGIGASGQAIFGLYAGDEENPAATKSWGGINMQEGDLVIGDASRGASMFWDNNWGSLYIGNGGASSSQLLLDSTDIRMYSNSVVRFHLTGTGNMRIYDEAAVERFAIGSTGIMTIKDGGGNAVFTFDSSTGAEFTKSLTLGTSGGIYQGSGTFGTPTTGLKIWNDTGVGRIAGYNAGVEQWGADTNGYLLAGGGVVRLDYEGLSFPLATGTTIPTIIANLDRATSIRWKSGSDVLAGIAAGYFSAGTENTLMMMAGSAGSADNAAVELRAINDSNAIANLRVVSDATDQFIEINTEYIEVIGDIHMNGFDITGVGTLTATGDISGDVFRAKDDTGGEASAITLTNASNTAANSTGAGSVKMKGTTARDSVGFIKMYNGTTAIYIPYWTTITG